MDSPIVSTIVIVLIVIAMLLYVSLTEERRGHYVTKSRECDDELMDLMDKEHIEDYNNYIKDKNNPQLTFEQYIDKIYDL